MQMLKDLAIPFLIVSSLMLLDIVTGVIKGAKEKNLSSSIMREGAFHKTGSILCIVFGVAVDYGQSVLDLGITVPIAISLCTYISLMECGSIIENLGAINPELLGDKFRGIFQKLNNK